ncbi:MAG: DUF6600 domain-containing protein, partial [Candidatus Aminicenantales bacterium]
MNKMMTKAALLALAFIVSIPLGLAAQDEGYYPYSFARLSYVNGSVSVQRTSDLGYEKGEVNLALVQGDKMGTESGQAEIHFGRRNYLRLGDNTKVEFAVLPSEGDERINIHLTEGSAYFRVSALATEKGIEVHTPDASFYVLEEGLYRFDVGLEGQTQVFVREGSLEAAAEEGSVLVKAQEAVTAADGRLLGQPEYGNSRNDAFDEWNGSRDSQLSARSERQYLPTEIGEYEEELDQNGHWVYERPYGNVWIPNVSDSQDWQPYYYGRWVWYPVIGWNWVSSESWGWSTYHYGRWNWRFGLGWYWIPQSHWGPAWVHWWSDRDYVGWCPLTWYNRPGYLFNNRFYDRYDDRYFSAHNRAMTVVRRDHLQSYDVGRRHVGSADLDRIGRVELRAQQPSIRPNVDNGRPQAIAARRALADRPGSRNQVKSLAPSRSLSSSSLRQRGTDSGLRSRDRGTSQPGGNSNVISRPSIRNDGAGSRSIRSYPSQRTSGGRDQSGIVENGRSAVASPSRSRDTGTRSNDARVSRSQGQDPGSSRTSTVREPQRARTPGNGSGSSVSPRGESVKSYPSTTRQGTSDKGDRTTSTTRTIRSGSDRSSNSSSGRSQSRTYSSRSSVSSPTSRMSAPSVSSSRPSSAISRPSSSSRTSSPSYSSSRSSRAPSSSQPRSSYASPSRSSSSSSARARNSYSSPSKSSSPSNRTYSAPRSSGSSSGRSYSAPRSSGSSSGRSYSAPRSSGSSS